MRSPIRQPLHHCAPTNTVHVRKEIIYRFSQFFCWQLLICENTLIQVVKLKNKKKKKKKTKEKISYPRWEPNPGRRRLKPDISPLRPWAFIDIFHVNFNTYFFLRDKLPISMKMLVFFLAKCVRNAVKTMVVDRKKPKSTSSAIFGVETAAKSCELKRCADRVRTEPTRQIWTFRLNFIA